MGHFLASETRFHRESGVVRTPLSHGLVETTAWVFFPSNYIPQYSSQEKLGPDAPHTHHNEMSLLLKMVGFS